MYYCQGAIHRALYNPLDNCSTAVVQEENKMNTIEKSYETAKTMNVNLDVNVEAAPAATYNMEGRQRNYLESRLYMIVEEKRNAARIQFGISDDKTPKSPQEIIDRIKAGNITISNRWESDVDDEDRYRFYEPWSYLRWRNPNTVKDTAGFEAWDKKLVAAREKVFDVIQIASPADALKALQDFEATTIQ